MDEPENLMPCIPRYNAVALVDLECVWCSVGKEMRRRLGMDSDDEPLELIPAGSKCYISGGNGNGIEGTPYHSYQCLVNSTED